MALAATKISRFVAVDPPPEPLTATAILRIPLTSKAVDDSLRMAESGARCRQNGTMAAMAWAMGW